MHQNPAAREYMKQSIIVLDACETSALSKGVSPMASVGKAHSCPPVQSPETKLPIRRISCSSGDMECTPIENELVDAGIDDEAIEVQQPHVIAGRVQACSMFWR